MSAGCKSVTSGGGEGMRRGLKRTLRLLLLANLLSVASVGQDMAKPDMNSEILQQLRQLSVSLEKTQAQLAESQQEIRQLRAKIDAMEALQQGIPGATGRNEASATGVLPQAAVPATNISQDDWEVMNARVNELHQTKVESEIGRA